MKIFQQGLSSNLKNSPNQVGKAISRRDIIVAAAALATANMAQGNLFDLRAAGAANSNGRSNAELDAAELPQRSEVPINTVFFDLGDTLVKAQDRSWLPGMQDGLGELRSRGLRLGIISNTGKLSRQELADKYLPPDFKFSDFVSSLTILSSEVRVRKPAREIWLLAAERAKENIQNCLFVGENMIETWHAQGAGMRTVRLCDPKNDMKTLMELLDGKA